MQFRSCLWRSASAALTARGLLLLALTQLALSNVKQQPLDGFDARHPTQLSHVGQDRICGAVEFKFRDFVDPHPFVSPK